MLQPKSARLCFHFLTRNRGKGGEVVKVYTINFFSKWIYPQQKLISKNRQQEVERVDESEIFPTRQIFVSTVIQEIEENVLLNSLILTPPTKTVNNCIHLDFIAVFFAYTFLTSSENWKTKNCQSEKEVNQVLYSEMDGWQCHNKQHGNTMPEKAGEMFLCSLQIN